MNVFALNIGNTNIQYALFENGIARKIFKIPSKNYKNIRFPNNLLCAGASVDPEISNELNKLHKIFWITPTIKTDCDISSLDTSNLGADRLSNIIALAKFAEKAAFIIDFGTAITIDFLDENKIYRGGAILPGRNMMRKALSTWTKKIPLIPFPEKVIPCGKNTSEAVSSGIDIGAIGSVREIIKQIAKEFRRKSFSIFATGGDRLYFTRNMSEIIDCGENFTLKGVVIASELNHEG